MAANRIEHRKPVIRAFDALYGETCIGPQGLHLGDGFKPKLTPPVLIDIPWQNLKLFVPTAATLDSHKTKEG